MNFVLTRKLIIFGLVLPLAVIMGFALASPLEPTTLLLVGAITVLLLMPVMLKWYHPLLIFTWNAFINVFFLPGKPQLWMLVAAIGFGIMVLNSTLQREKSVIHVPALTIPILFLLAVVLVTAKLTGGIGLRSLGGGQIGGGLIGGKGYVFIIFAVLGYFVLASKAVPPERVQTYVSIFFMSGVTGMFSNLAYMLGSAFYFLFYLFPVELAVNQAVSELPLGGGIVRISGLAYAAAAAYFFMAARFGIRGIFDVKRPWRLASLLLMTFIGLFGGFRSLLLTLGIHFVIQFYLEGLARTRVCLFLLLGGIAAGVVAFPFVDKMPLSVQRCVAFIPGVHVNAVAKLDAENSTRWRLEMWSVLLPQVPNYLILGKGYALNPADLYLASQAELRGLAKNYEVSIVAGSYHNGPLSVIIPFGIFGALGFLWLIGAGIWVLYRNFRYGDPSVHLANTFLLAYFMVRVIVFFFMFGGLEGDLFMFTGTLGLSVAINCGVRKPVETLEAPADVALQPAPA